MSYQIPAKKEVIHTIKTIFALYKDPNVTKVDGPPTSGWTRKTAFTSTEYFEALRYFKIPERPSKTKERRLHFWEEQGKEHLGLYYRDLKEKD